MERPRLHSALPDAQYEDLAALENNRQLNDLRLKGTFEHIFQKYSRDFSNVGDEIDLRTGEIVVNNGHVAGMMDECDTGEDIWRESDSESENEAREQPTEPSNPGLAAMDGPAATNGPVATNSPAQDPQAALQALGQSIAAQIGQFMQTFPNGPNVDPMWAVPPLPGMPQVTQTPGRIMQRPTSSIGRSIWAPESIGRPRNVFTPGQIVSRDTHGNRRDRRPRGIRSRETRSREPRSRETSINIQHSPRRRSWDLTVNATRDSPRFTTRISGSEPAQGPRRSSSRIPLAREMYPGSIKYNPHNTRLDGEHFDSHEDESVTSGCDPVSPVSKKNNHRPWTEEDEAKLLELRKKKLDWSAIASVLGRPEYAPRNHYFKNMLHGQKRKREVLEVPEVPENQFSLDVATPSTTVSDSAANNRTDLAKTPTTPSGSISYNCECGKRYGTYGGLYYHSRNSDCNVTLPSQRTSINKKRTAFLKLVELNPSYADRDYKTCTLQNMKKELDELQPGWDAEILVAMAGATESVKRAKVTKETKPGRALEISNQPLERDQPLPVELGQPLEFEPDQQPSEGTNFQFLEIPDSQASQVTMSDGPLEGIIEAAAGMSPAAGFVQSSTTTIDPFNLESGIRGDMSADAKDALGARRKSRKESSTRTPKLLQKSPSEHTPQQPVRLDPVTHKKHRVEVAISQMRNQETEESTDGSAEHARNQAAAKEALQTPNTLQSIDSTASSKGRPNGKHPFVVKTPSTKRSGKATESIVENLVNGSSGKPVVKAVADTPVNASAAKSPATPGVRTPINASSAKSIAKKPFATPANASPRKKSNGELPSAKPSAKPSANSMTEAPAQNTEGTAAKNRKASATEAEASPTAKTPKSTAVHRLQASGPKNPSTPQVESSTDKRDPGTVRGPKSGSRLSILDMMDCSEDELAF